MKAYHWRVHGMEAYVTMSDEWLTTREAARLLKIHMITLTKWAAGGYVPATKIGRCWRYSRVELEAWIRDPVKRLALVPDAPLPESSVSARVIQAPPMRSHVPPATGRGTRSRANS